MGKRKQRGMPEDYRALLTDREKEILTNREEEDDKYYYRVVTRVRKKIQKLEDDMEILNQHPTLADELKDIVCKDN